MRWCGGTYAHVCTGARHVQTEFSNIVKPHGGTKASSCYVCGARAHARGITIDARGNNSSNGVAPESTSSRCACAHTNHHCPNTPPSPPYSRHRLHGWRADWATGYLATCCEFDSCTEQLLLSGPEIVVPGLDFICIRTCTRENPSVRQRLKKHIQDEHFRTKPQYTYLRSHTYVDSVQ